MPAQSTATFAGQEPLWRCQAATKASKRRGDPKRCPLPVVPGRNVCSQHGGHAGRPGYGRFAKALGKKHGDAYRATLEGGQIWNLDRGLALLAMQVEHAAERLAQLDTPAYRKQCLNRLNRMREAEDPSLAAQELNALSELIERGVEEDAAMERLAYATSVYQERVERAWNQRLHRADVINKADFRSAMAQLVAIVAQSVMAEAPRDAAERILQRVDRQLSGAGAGDLAVGEDQRQGQVGSD